MASERRIRQAAIVAGGLGSRARSMTGDAIPKALLPVDGVPIVFRQMAALASEGVESVVVLAGHLGRQLEAELEPEARRLGLRSKVIVEDAPLGTAGCLCALADAGDDVLIVYGDMLFDMCLAPLLAFHRAKSALLTIVVHPNDHPRTSDLVVESGGLVRQVLPAKVPRDRDYRNLVPAGVYLASPQFLSRMAPGRKADMIHDVIPRLVGDGEAVAAYDTPEYLRDVGTPARHGRAERDVRAGRVVALRLDRKRPAVFLDCDGVLNAEPGGHGVLRPDDVRLLPGASAAVRQIREAGQLAIAVTNRAQVAKGMLDEEGLAGVLGRLEAELADGGGQLDRIYYCPHHPEGGHPGEIAALKIECRCRKPGPLMLERAAQELPVDMTRSALIGDSLRDIGAARAVGIWAYGVRTGYGCKDFKRYPGGREAIPVPDAMLENIEEAVALALGYAAIAEPVLQAVSRLPASRAPQLIAISGRARSGKSVLAHAVARTLHEAGARPLIVDLDGWIVPIEQRNPHMGAEACQRVEIYPEIVARLRAGEIVSAPGYDSISRGAGRETRYDASGASHIVLAGVLAGHPLIRGRLDLLAFKQVADGELERRFLDYYRWKGMADGDALALLGRRRGEEWPVVDAQRGTADIVLWSGDQQR